MPIVKVGQTGGSEKAAWGAPNERGPLSGIKVLDLTHIIAGPACSRMLAEYGADVLLVRRSGGFAEQESCMNEFDGWAIAGTNGFPSPATINTAWPFRRENLIFTEGDNWSQS